MKVVYKTDEVLRQTLNFSFLSYPGFLSAFVITDSMYVDQLRSCETLMPRCSCVDTKS